MEALLPMETLLAVDPMEAMESMETLESEHPSPVGPIVSRGLHRFP